MHGPLTCNYSCMEGLGFQHYFDLYGRSFEVGPIQSCGQRANNHHVRSSTHIKTHLSLSLLFDLLGHIAPQVTLVWGCCFASMVVKMNLRRKQTNTATNTSVCFTLCATLSYCFLHFSVSDRLIMFSNCADWLYVRYATMVIGYHSLSCWYRDSSLRILGGLGTWQLEWIHVYTSRGPSPHHSTIFLAQRWMKGVARLAYVFGRSL